MASQYTAELQALRKVAYDATTAKMQAQQRVQGMVGWANSPQDGTLPNLDSQWWDSYAEAKAELDLAQSIETQARKALKEAGGLYG